MPLVEISYDAGTMRLPRSSTYSSGTGDIRVDILNEGEIYTYTKVSR